MTAEPIALPVHPHTPSIRVRRVGPSYVVEIPDLDPAVTFRDVRADRELSADVSINVADVHIFRTTTSLALVGRDRLAKTTTELARNASGDLWRRAIFAATEAVLEGEERLGGGVDLRTSSVRSSFRFGVPAGGETWNRSAPASLHNPSRLPERSIREARVLEFGPVVFPAYAGATSGISAGHQSGRHRAPNYLPVSEAAFREWVAQRGAMMSGGARSCRPT